MAKILFICLTIGVLAGLIGALCGVGGGIIMVPAFVLILGMAEKAAVATSMAVVVATSLSATANNYFSKSGLIDWKIVGVTALGAIVAAWFGSDLMRTLSNQQISRIFGGLMVVLGVHLLVAR